MLLNSLKRWQPWAVFILFSFSKYIFSETDIAPTNLLYWIQAILLVIAMVIVCDLTSKAYKDN